jgi:phage tail sheath gpL-like
VSISFNTIPSNIRVPFVAVEFDNTRATQGPTLLAYRVLLMGQKTSSGTSTADTLQRVTNADQVATFAGRGSQLHRMAKAYFANNTFTETWIGVLADAGAGVSAAGTITVTGPATESGTINLYIAGVYVPVAVASGDAQNAIAAAIKAAIDDDTDLPITATVATNVVTWTAKNDGTEGNDFDFRLNYQDGEETPSGVSLAFASTATGATNPSLSGLIATMGDLWFQVIAHPYTDATSLTSIETELASRWGPMRQIDGVAITSAAGSTSTLGTLGDSRNSPHSVIVAQPGASPLTPPSQFAAAVAGVVAFRANSDPGRPLQTLEINGVLPPTEADSFTLQERNLALYDGIGTTKTAAGGVVQIERLVTTYQTNAAGSADTSYLDVTTMLTLLYLRFSFRAKILAEHPRSKLMSDGARVPPGQAVITPKIGKSLAVGWFREMEDLLLVENFEQFVTDLVVERDESDPNRLNFLLPPDLANQFIVGAANTQFRL